MSQAVHGQHVGRQERVEQYANWSGASPVGEDGQVKQASEGLTPVAAAQLANDIRQNLSAGVSKVRLDISDKVTIEAIKALLTSKELEKVQFGSEEFPVA